MKEGWTRNPVEDFRRKNQNAGTPAWTLKSYLDGEKWKPSRNLAWLREVARLGLPVHRVGFRDLEGTKPLHVKLEKKYSQRYAIPQAPSDGKGHTRWEVAVLKALGYMVTRVYK